MWVGCSHGVPSSGKVAFVYWSAFLICYLICSHQLGAVSSYSWIQNPCKSLLLPCTESSAIRCFSTASSASRKVRKDVKGPGGCLVVNWHWFPPFQFYSFCFVKVILIPMRCGGVWVCIACQVGYKGGQFLKKSVVKTHENFSGKGSAAERPLPICPHYPHPCNRWQPFSAAPWPFFLSALSSCGSACPFSCCCMWIWTWCSFRVVLPYKKQQKKKVFFILSAAPWWSKTVSLWS